MGESICIPVRRPLTITIFLQVYVACLTSIVLVVLRYKIPMGRPDGRCTFSAMPMHWVELDYRESAVDCIDTF